MGDTVSVLVGGPESGENAGGSVMMAILYVFMRPPIGAALAPRLSLSLSVRSVPPIFSQ